MDTSDGWRERAARPGLVFVPTQAQRAKGQSLFYADLRQPRCPPVLQNLCHSIGDLAHFSRGRGDESHAWR